MLNMPWRQRFLQEVHRLTKPYEALPWRERLLSWLAPRLCPRSMLFVADRRRMTHLARRAGLARRSLRLALRDRRRLQRELQKLHKLKSADEQLQLDYARACGELHARRQMEKLYPALQLVQLPDLPPGMPAIIACNVTAIFRVRTGKSCCDPFVQVGACDKATLAAVIDRLLSPDWSTAPAIAKEAGQ